MFKRAITETAFTTLEANDFFAGSIPLARDPSTEDITFTSTLRALVYPRMKELGTEKLCFFKVNRGGEIFSNVIDVLRSVDHDALLVYEPLRGSEDGNRRFIEDSITRLQDEGYEEIKKIHDFFMDVFYVRCVVNDEKRNAVIYVLNGDLRRLHYLQCCLPAVLRWYFDPEKRLSELEMKLIRSFMNSDSEEYMSTLDEMAKAYNFEEGRIHRVLHGFETIRIDRRINDLRMQIANIEERVNQYSRRIHDEMMNAEELNYTLAGCINAKSDDSGETTELEDYFICNKSVSLESGDFDGMTFVTMGYISYYDDDQAETLINNKRGIIENALNSIPEGTIKISAGNIRKLMKKIFIEKEYKLRVCGAFSFSADSYVTAINGYNYSSKFRTYMPNPHLDRYSCLGDNRVAIERHLRDGDYVFGVEQCVSSVISLNFVDTAVMTTFIQRLCSKNAEDKFIELPNGNIVSPVEACEIINKEG